MRRLVLRTCLDCDSIHHVGEGELFVCEVCGFEHVGGCTRSPV